MSNIKNIQDKIDGFAQMLVQYEALLAQDVTNFSNQLSVNSFKAQISELERELQFEKAKRNKEIVEIRLIGRNADGTLPLEILAKLADGFSGAIINASNFIQFGNKKSKSNSEFISNAVDLRLAGIATGSTRLFVTAKNSPDLFGKSLSEESLNHSFNLLQSNTPEELTESASKIGKESVKKLNKFITTISNADLEVDLNWTTPTNEKMEWKGDKATLLKVAQSLSNIVMSEPEKIAFKGKLVGISLRGTFEIKTDDNKNIKGTYSKDLLETAKTLTIDSNYSGDFEKKVIINSATGSEQTFYSLISIKSAK